VTPLLLAAVLSGIVVDVTGAADDARLPTVTLHVGIPLPPGCDYSLQPPAFTRAPAPRASFRGWTATRGETVTLGDRSVQARRDGFFEFPELIPASTDRILREPKRRQPVICL